MPETKVVINRFPIKLGQFLKIAEVVSDGFEAKLKITSGEVSVNGTVDLRRGRQLLPGDRVSIGDTVYVCSAP